MMTDQEERVRNFIRYGAMVTDRDMDNIGPAIGILFVFAVSVFAIVSLWNWIFG